MNPKEHTDESSPIQPSSFILHPSDHPSERPSIWSISAVQWNAGFTIVTSLFATWSLSTRNAFVPPILLTLLPAIAIVSVWGRGRLGPGFFFLIVAAIQFRLADHPLGIIPNYEPMELGDLALAAFLLAYLVGHYRFLVLCDRIAPKSKRRGRLARLIRGAQDPPAPAILAEVEQPPPKSFTATHEEMIRLVVFLPLWPTLAVWLWRGVQACWPFFLGFGISPYASLLLTTLWLLAGSALVVRVVVLYLSRYRMTPLEAEISLYDVVWRELRREMDHVSKALARVKRGA